MPRIGSISNTIQESKTGIQFTRVQHWRLISNLKGIIRKIFWDIPNRSIKIKEQEESPFERSYPISFNAMQHPFKVHLSHQAISWMASTLDEAALKGCAYTVIPEALGDILFLYHLLNAKDTGYLKTATNLVLVALSGSWLSSGAAWLTKATLKKAGCSEFSSNIASDLVAVVIHTIKNLNPVVFATSVVSCIGGKLGLWVEKKTIQQLAFANLTDHHQSHPHDYSYVIDSDSFGQHQVHAE